MGWMQSGHPTIGDSCNSPLEIPDEKSWYDRPPISVCDPTLIAHFVCASSATESTEEGPPAHHWPERSRKGLEPHPVGKKTRVAVSNSVKCRLCEVDSAYPEAMLTWDTKLPNFSATRNLSKLKDSNSEATHQKNPLQSHGSYAFHCGKLIFRMESSKLRLQLGELGAPLISTQFLSDGDESSPLIPIPSHWWNNGYPWISPLWSYRKNVLFSPRN